MAISSTFASLPFSSELDESEITELSSGVISPYICSWPLSFDDNDSNNQERAKCKALLNCRRSLVQHILTAHCQSSTIDSAKKTRLGTVCPLSPSSCMPQMSQSGIDNHILTVHAKELGLRRYVCPFKDCPRDDLSSTQDLGIHFASHPTPTSASPELFKPHQTLLPPQPITDIAPLPSNPISLLANVQPSPSFRAPVWSRDHTPMTMHSTPGPDHRGRKSTPSAKRVIPLFQSTDSIDQVTEQLLLSPPSVHDTLFIRSQTSSQPSSTRPHTPIRSIRTPPKKRSLYSFLRSPSRDSSSNSSSDSEDEFLFPDIPSIPDHNLIVGQPLFVKPLQKLSGPFVQRRLSFNEDENVQNAEGEDELPKTILYPTFEEMVERMILEDGIEGS